MITIICNDVFGLDNNNIRIVDRKAFKGLAKLKVLGLQYNKIEKIENNSFEDLKSLDVLDLGEWTINYETLYLLTIHLIQVVTK